MRVAPVKSTVSLDILNKVDIRVGKIELVDDVPGSRKLVRLIVDFGDHKRRILVGMRQEHSNPKEIEGKQALFVINLEPKKMMGKSPKVCCWILDMPMESSLCSLSQKALFQTEPEPDDQNLAGHSRSWVGGDR